MTKNKNILLTNGIVKDPILRIDRLANVLIHDGKIEAILDSIPSGDFDVVDVKGCWILPGFIDMHVHLREPGFEYKETISTGTLGAVRGGFTSVVAMANTQPVNDSAYVTAYLANRIKETAHCRVFIVGAVTKNLQGEELAEIGGMVKEGAVAFSDDGMPVMNSYLMRKAMDYAKAFDVPIISHAEDKNLVGQGVMNEGALSNQLGLRGVPAAAEEIMVAREIALCRLTRCRVHIAHLSTEIALQHVIRAKKDGLPITAEVSPHHLTLTEESIRSYDTNFKMAPPLRTQKDVDALIDGLNAGWIDCIATDHAPHGKVDKQVEFDHAACGITGLQTALGVTFKLVKSGKLELNQWIKSYTSGPAKILNQELGTLKAGTNADITVFNPNLVWTFDENENCSKSSNNPFNNEKFTGKAVATLVGGQFKYNELLGLTALYAYK